MQQSNTYRRSSNVTHRPRTNWELIYGSVAMKLIRRGNIHMENVMPVAKFIGAFVWFFSLPYTAYKWLWLRIKVAKIKAKQKD